MLLVLFPGLELESLPSVFAGSDSTSASSSRFTAMVIPAKGWEVGGEGGGLGRLFKGGDFFKGFCQRGAIIGGRRLIEGLLLF